MHQVGHHNNRRHAPISIETTWAKKLKADRKFSWYLTVSTVNANLAHGHFQNEGELTPTLQFRRELAQELMEKYSGEEYWGGGRPQKVLYCINTIVL